MAIAPSESRFRVTVCFPIRNEAAYHTTLNWLIKKLNKEYWGVTLSVHQPLAVFRGYFFSEKVGLIPDRVILLISDAELSAERDVEELDKYLRYIKRELHKRLPREEEFWIAYHPITRIIQPQKSDIVSSA